MVRKYSREGEGMRIQSIEHIQGQLRLGVGLQLLRATSGTHTCSQIAGERYLRLDERALRMSRIQQAKMGRVKKEGWAEEKHSQRIEPPKQRTMGALGAFVAEGLRALFLLCSRHN